MKIFTCRLLGYLSLLAVCTPAARAQLDIVPTFDSTITNDTSNASAIESAINAAIANVEAVIANPVTVNIDFQEMTTGLGQSSTFIGTFPYSTYVGDLGTKQTPSVADTTAIASLTYNPAVTTNNPVNGNASITTTVPLLRALGETGAPGAGSFDSTISLNTSISNFSRTNPDLNKYDLEATAAHEIDEVLGIGGPGSELVANGSLSGPVGPLDLFRYGGTGARSYNTSSTTHAYFSINAGATNLVNFNQNANGDFADWGNGSVPSPQQGNNPPQVQDAFGDPGTASDIGKNEVTALDVVGWNLTAQGLALEGVPEPSTWVMVGAAAVGLLAYRLRVGRQSAT